MVDHGGDWGRPMSSRARIWNNWEHRYKPQRRRSRAYRTRRALRRWLRAYRIANESPTPQPEAVARMRRIEARAEWPFRLIRERGGL